eukprot:1111494-Prymnesium_polylepis.1
MMGGQCDLPSMPPLCAPATRSSSSATIRQLEGDQRSPSVLRLGTISLRAFPRVAALCIDVSAQSDSDGTGFRSARA